MRKGAISDILEENVVQPLLVSTSAITLATETVRSILKIDDIVSFLFSVYGCSVLLFPDQHHELSRQRRSSHFFSFSNLLNLVFVISSREY